jgi:hypothetical protein
MTTRHYEVVESDLSGEADATTVTFAFKGSLYEVDLTEAEEKKLAKALEPYLKAGRKAAPEKRPARRALVPDTTFEQREKIRAWAKEKGYDLADRGRIPKNVFADYQAAHSE